MRWKSDLCTQLSPECESISNKLAVREGQLQSYSLSLFTDFFSLKAFFADYETDILTVSKQQLFSNLKTNGRRMRKNIKQRPYPLTQGNATRKNQNVFVTLTGHTYVWIISKWTFQQKLGKRTEVRDWDVSNLGETQSLLSW